MAKNKKHLNNEKPGEEKPLKKFDICSFRVPVIIVYKDDGIENKKSAEFKEVEMKDLCFKIETVETEDANAAQKIAQKVAEDNNRLLRLAAQTKTGGQLIIRKVMCDHGKIIINNNL